MSITPQAVQKLLDEAAYLQRTEWNVRDTGGTVIFSLSPVLTGGSKKTWSRVGLREQDCDLQMRMIAETYSSPG